MINDVKYLVEMGFAVHLLQSESKAPVENGWSTAPVYSYNELSDQYREGQNVGVRLGKPSRIDGLYLHVIDLDIRDENRRDEALNALKSLFSGRKLDRMWRVASGSGGSSRHYYFLCDTHFPTENLARSEDFVQIDGRKRRVWEIDLLGTGKQVVLPPSIHPDTGAEYEWIIEPDEYPVEVDSDWLSSVLEPEDYSGVERDNSEPLGLMFSEAESILKSVQHLSDDHEQWVRVGMALKHEFGEDGWELFDDWSRRGHGYNRKDNLYQWKRFNTDRREIVTMRSISAEAREVEVEDLIGDLDDGETVRKEVEIAQAEVKLAAEDEAEDKPARVRQKGDPDMSLVREARYRSPKLPLHILGTHLAAEVKLQAKTSSSPEDFVFASLLAGASAVLGNAVMIEAMPGYTQKPILWCQIIGDPSTNKSPSVRPVMNALREIEKMYLPFYKEAHDKWETARDRAVMAEKAWAGMAKGMAAEGQEPPPKPDAAKVPAEPPERPFVINDTTIEAFLQLQSRAPRGFLMFRDELAGWLASMERYSAESDRSVWLESYDGGDYTVSRVKFGNERQTIRSICAPVLGGIQPERLLAITGESTVDDGLQARILPFWPDRKFRPMSREGATNARFVALLSKLAEIPMMKDNQDRPTHRVVPFTAPAFDEFAKWSDSRKLHERNVPVRLMGVYGKAEGQVIRLAGVLQFLWWADDTFAEDKAPTVIKVEAVRAAIKLREEYFKPTQQKVYEHAIESDDIMNARVIANWIVQEDVDIVNVRQMRREAGLKGMRNTTEKSKVELIDAAISALVYGRWLIEPKREEHERGRPSKTFEVNPRIWELLDD